MQGHVVGTLVEGHVAVEDKRHVGGLEPSLLQRGLIGLHHPYLHRTGHGSGIFRERVAQHQVADGALGALEVRGVDHDLCGCLAGFEVERQLRVAVL